MAPVHRREARARDLVPVPALLARGRRWRWGWCNAVVPDEQLDAEVRAWCDEILEKSPTAIAIAKRSFNADTASIAGISGMGLQAVNMFYGTEESQEGVRAFKEKRKPEFRKFVR